MLIIVTNHVLDKLNNLAPTTTPKHLLTVDSIRMKNNKQEWVDYREEKRKRLSGSDTWNETETGGMV